MSPDRAAREARAMAELVALWELRRLAAERERGSSSLLLLVAALPVVLGVVYVMGALAGAVSGVAGVQ